MATPRHIIDKVTFGGIYKVDYGTWPNGSSNDQCYYIAVPVMDDVGNLWMQDTYQLDRPCYKSNKDNVTDLAIAMICEFGEGYSGWCVKHARFNFYYKNQMRVETDKDLSHFNLIADLHDYHWIGHEDYRDYDENDILFNIPLFFEHGYSWNYGRAKGGVLIKNGAQKQCQKMFSRAVSDVMGRFVWPDYASDYFVEKVDKEAKRCEDSGVMTEEMKEKERYVKMLNDKLREMRSEFSSLYNDIFGNNIN